MKLTEQIREYIKCPQFGDKHYGIWGLLSYRQRFLIKKLCEQCDIYEDAADKFVKENIKFKQQLAEKEKENRILTKALELACEKIEFMAQMLGQTLDYNVEENFIEQAKGEKDE